MTQRDPKILNVIAEVRRLIGFPGALHIHSHTFHRHPDVTRPEIEYVLKKTGEHVPEKDQYDNDFGWKYHVAGETVDGDALAVIVSFLEEPPIPEKSVLVVTAYYKRSGKPQ